jgi:hypothetical protein
MFVPRERSWTVEELREAVAQSTSLTDVLRALGLRPAGGNHANIRAWIKRLGFSTEHFVHRVVVPRSEPRPLEEVLVAGSTYPRRSVKQRLYSEGLKQRTCEMCGQGEDWNGRHMSLILDHINGVADDNRLENLRIVCPNCAATLDTHCGSNKRRVLVDRPCEICGATFRPRYAQQRFCSHTCAHRRDRGVPKPALRRVERPPYEQLIAEVKQVGFSATGRKYGVSDNAVRKWILAAERERDRTRREEAA